jgi:hypothetical protein
VWSQRGIAMHPLYHPATACYHGGVAFFPGVGFIPGKCDHSDHVATERDGKRDHVRARRNSGHPD